MSDTKPPGEAKGVSVWTKIAGIGVLIGGFIAALAGFVSNVDAICSFAQKHGVNVCGPADNDPLNSLDDMSKYIKG